MTIDYSISVSHLIQYANTNTRYTCPQCNLEMNSIKTMATGKAWLILPSASEEVFIAIIAPAAIRFT